MSFVSRGFHGKRRDPDTSGRLPPGQYLTDGFPVLSAGPTPHTPLDQWSFRVVDGEEELRRWSWEEFRALPSEEITVDIHCVTTWSKLDTAWQGVSLDTLLDGVETEAEYAVAFSDGGYTTNLPLEDLTGGKAWVAFGYDGEPLDPDHGRAARRRRGLALPRGRGRRRRSLRAARAGRRLLRLGGRERRAAPARRRGLRDRAADVDDPAPRGGRKHGARPAPLLVSDGRGRRLPRRARAARR